MGNIFSRPKNTSQKLFDYEERILNVEAQLMNIRGGSFSWRLVLVHTTLIPVVYAFGVNMIISVISQFICFGILYLFRKKYKKSCIRMLEYRLKKLKEEQKMFVSKAKTDIDFDNTRRLIEKYETKEHRDAFFTTIMDKKRGSFSKLADIILANDPSKMNALICRFCGQHNGLLDPLNSEIKYFYCYDCKKKNNRLLEGEIPEMTEDEELDEIIRKSEEELTNVKN